MSLSTQFENMREMMYAETRQMLEARDVDENDMGKVRIEQVQAWIMVTFYEFLRTNYRRGYTTAGRVFRLVQLLRLHEVDSPTADIRDHNAASLGDWAATEERRRVFWVAYCLDRFISVGNKGLLTLSEEVVRAHSIWHGEGMRGRQMITDHCRSSDLYRSSFSRDRFPEQPCRPDMVSIRSHGIQQPVFPFGRVCHYGHNMRACSVPRPCLRRRANLW